MDYRGLVITGAVVAAAVFPLLPACSAPDPGQITFVARNGATANPSDENGDQSSSGNAIVDGGTSGSTSSGDATVAVKDVFGTEKFAFADPGETANGQPAPHAPPMQGQACGQGGCHGDPAAAGPKWSAAGSVFNDAAGTALTAGTQFEIRITTGDFATVIGGGQINPDTDGNFWLDPGGTPSTIPDGARVGIRTATGAIHMMNTPLTAATGANCNSAGCHATMRIFGQ